MFRRFDIGWKDPSGNHGLIAAHDGGLAPEEASPLYQWTDLTRSPFQTHWFLIALTSQTTALIRVSPIEGGTRGTASYSHVLLFAADDVESHTDLGQLIDLFPAVPLRIGQPSSWQSDQPVAPQRELSMHQLAADPALIAVMMNLPLPLKQCELVDPGSLTQDEQITLILRSYALDLQRLHAAGLNFATSAAPGFARPYLGFGQPTSRVPPNVRLVQAWLSFVDRLEPQSRRAVDLRNPCSMFSALTQQIATEPDLAAYERVENLVEKLLAAPMGALEDAKFSAVEQGLATLAPAIKGEFLIALLRRLEKAPIDGAHPLWILRLLSDPAAINELATADREIVLQRFFEALPNQLEGIVPKLSPEARRATLNTLHKTLLAHGNGETRHPPGFVALARSVLRSCLFLLDMVREHYQALLAMRLVRQLMQPSLERSAISDMATELTAEIVRTPAVFAACLLDLGVFLTRQSSYTVEIEKELEPLARVLLPFLLHQSFTCSPQSRLVDCIVRALEWHGTNSSQHNINTVFDGFQVALPKKEQEWIPPMRKCLSVAGARRLNGGI